MCLTCFLPYRCGGFLLTAPLPVSKGGCPLLNHSEGDGFAELLNFSHMVAPEVLGLKNGGFLAGFWLTGPDLESSTVQELEHLSEMMARAIHQLDMRWCVHFEFFRREAHNYPNGHFHETRIYSGYFRYLQSFCRDQQRFG